MTTFSTVDSNPFPITTTMATSSAAANSSMNDGNDIYYYHPITGMTVLLVEGLPHQPSPPGPQQHPLEQWNTATTTDPLNIYAVQHHQQQSQPEPQVISQIYTRTAQPVFSYNNIAPITAGATHQQQHHNQQNTHQQQQQQHTIVNTAVTTASTPMVTTSNANIYLSNNPAATITTTSAQPQRQQLGFLIKEEDLIQEIEPWFHSTASSSIRQQDNNDITPISTHSAPLTTTTTSFADDTLQDCIDMIVTSDCNSNRVTTRPEDMYSTNNNSNSNNNNNNNNNYLNSSSTAPSTVKNTSLVVTSSLSEPLTTLVGTRNTAVDSRISLSNDSNSGDISSFQSNYNKSTEHKRIKSMSAIFEQQQLQQQQQWNIDVALPEVDWQLVGEDPEALPRLQKPRYKQDDYNPKWVRYTAHNKEGYCDTCGRWLQLKNSAYWYHKQFYHGISSVSGKPFLEPLEQRISSEGVIEGLCHQCGYFVPICNGKRQKNSLLWYKHAHKCHIYNKPEKFTTTIPATSSHRSFPL